MPCFINHSPGAVPWQALRRAFAAALLAGVAHGAAQAGVRLQLEDDLPRWDHAAPAGTPAAAAQALLLRHVPTLHTATDPADAAQALGAWLTPALARRLAAYHARPRPGDEVPPLDGDPFTDTQEPPQAIELGSAAVQRAIATLPVRLHFAGGTSRTITYRLQRAPQAVGGWLLDDIAYGHGPTLRQRVAR